MTMTEWWAAMSAADQNDLPDSAFAYIEPGGTKDAEGKTTPRSKRHFPVHDKAHADNAAARIAQGAKFGDLALPKVKAAQKKFGESASTSADRAGFELRKRRRASMTGAPERRGMLLEVRAKPDGTGGTTFEFEGYGAVFDAPFDMWDKWGDPYTEVVKQGAFTRSLARPDLDVPFLIGHDDSRLALARTKNGTLKLSQDSHGMLCKATMDGRRSDVRDLAYAVERGDQDEMSIGFITRQQEWDDSYETRSMLDLDVHRGDVSSVALAANQATKGASMTAFPVEMLSQRAQVPNAVADEPSHDHMTPRVGPNHGSFDGTHTHAHPAFGSQGGDASHEHEHTHNGDAVHDHHTGSASQHRPGEQLAQGEIMDYSSSPDFNLPSAPAPYDAAAHSWKPSVTCPNNSCPVYAGGDGDRAENEMDASNCDQCGGPLYNSDGLIVADDSGVVEEVGGDMADADLLSRRLRLLELT